LRLFACTAPITSNIDQDDIIVKFFERPSTSDDPLVLILQIKDILGTFGIRSLLYTKIKATFYDEELPTQVRTWCLEMAQRRDDLKW